MNYNIEQNLNSNENYHLKNEYNQINFNKHNAFERKDTIKRRITKAFYFNLNHTNYKL